MAAETEMNLTDLEKNYFNALYMIFKAGKLLDIPQVGIAKASILFHKCMKRSKNSGIFVNRDFFLSMACCFLGAKSEESIRMYRDVLMVYDRIWKKCLKLSQEEIDKIFEVMEETRFTRWKTLLFKTEYQALHLLGHILNYEHSYKFLLSYLNALNLDDIQTDFFQRAWNYLNDSLYSRKCIEYRPEVLACSAIYLVSLEFSFPLPEEPHCWYEYFDVTREELESCCNTILSLYFLTKSAFDTNKAIRAEYDYTQTLHKKNVEMIKMQISRIKKKLEQTDKNESSSPIEKKDRQRSHSRDKRKENSRAGHSSSHSHSHSRRSSRTNRDSDGDSSVSRSRRRSDRSSKSRSRRNHKASRFTYSRPPSYAAETVKNDAMAKIEELNQKYKLGLNRASVKDQKPKPESTKSQNEEQTKTQRRKEGENEHENPRHDSKPVKSEKQYVAKAQNLLYSDSHILKSEENITTAERLKKKIEFEKNFGKKDRTYERKDCRRG